MAAFSPVFSCFFAKNTPCGRATKNPARHAARAPGAVSVNTPFSKILVTGVKRKIDLPVSLLNSGGQMAQCASLIAPYDGSRFL
jgi:hypothetical protein